MHNKSVHTCICVSVYVHIFLNYAFPWRNIYSCCFCPSPYHYFHGHRAITPISLFAAPSSNPTLSISVPCHSGLLLCPAAGSIKFLPNVVTYPPKCTVPRSPDDSNLLNHHLENLRSHILLPSLMINLCSECSIISHTFVYTFECSDSFPRLLLCYRSVVT